MKQLRSLLLPAAMVFAVLAAVFLPRQLSELHDRRLFTTAFRESFDGTSEFSSPNLLESLRLLSGRDSSMETFKQEIIRSDRMLAISDQIRSEILRLAEADILPWEVLYLMERAEVADVSLSYLRSQESFSGSSFIILNSMDEKGSDFLHLVLDEQSGKLLTLLYNSEQTALPADPPIREIGTHFLEWLGLSGEYHPINFVEDSIGAMFFIANSDLVYYFIRSDYDFDISFAFMGEEEKNRILSHPDSSDSSDTDVKTTIR